MKDIAISLLGNGLPPAAVLMTLQEKFPDLPSAEIIRVVTWATNQDFAPSLGRSPAYVPPQSIVGGRPKNPVEHAQWWLNGQTLEADELRLLSPVAITDKAEEYLPLFLASLFQERDYLNLVCRFEGPKGSKVNPKGGGSTRSRDEWIAYVQERGCPQSEAGAWMRINPCAPKGTGQGGAITDADVTAFRYLLVESDTLPITMQLNLFRRWRLPVVAIVLSGGESAHAWVKLESTSVDHFRDTANRLLKILKPFGIDEANKNPSRLCRLPGAIRKLGATGTGEQRLLWLNPNAQALSEEVLIRFEETLTFPFILEKPLEPLAQAAMARYRSMSENRGKLGVPTGIPKFDEDTGGLKKGRTLVIAGQTGAGKTTVALHMIKTALKANYGVLLFSLEMDREEIFDLIMADYAQVDRNKFNTGCFQDSDFPELEKAVAKLGPWPLFIEDAVLTSAEQIRTRVFQLKADNRIGLVVVDYIQFVNPGLTRESREQQVATISQTLRAVARESQVPMIVLSQLNDEGLLRESRVIGHNADIVMNVDLEKDQANLEIMKGRSVAEDSYTLNFERRYARINGFHHPRVRQGANIP
jgi:hypothetical protein